MAVLYRAHYWRELGIRHVDTVRYLQLRSRQPARTESAETCAEGDGEGFIVIDDLVDTGGTVAIREMYPKAHFVTIAKPAGRPLVDDYVIDIPQNTGFGSSPGYGCGICTADFRSLISRPERPAMPGAAYWLQ